MKPNVFPSNEDKKDSNEPAKVNPFIADKAEIEQAYVKPDNDPTVAAAAEAMRKRTEEQMKLRDEQLRKNLALTDNYNKMTQDATERRVNIPAMETTTVQHPTTVKEVVLKPSEPKVETTPETNKYIERLSQPDFSSAYDLIPLPSEGKIYPSKKSNVRVSFMTTVDEDILTSPNLLQSGQFLEILINRKLLEPNLRYKDLHVGDRNAIMLWIRATGFGEMYPVTLLDENDNAFETEINLNTLKTKKLGAEPDAEGLFDFILPVSKTKIKFRLLTVGDVDEIDALVEQDKLDGDPINHMSTYTLERTIVEVNGNRDKEYVKRFANSVRSMDSKNLREYINKIESGVDLNITVGTPGGGSVETFLPLNRSFFWPNIKL